LFITLRLSSVSPFVSIRTSNFNTPGIEKAVLILCFDKAKEIVR